VILFDCRVAIDRNHPAPTYALARAFGLRRTIPCSIVVRDGSPIQYALRLFDALCGPGDSAVLAIAEGHDYTLLFVTYEDEEGT